MSCVKKKKRVRAVILAYTAISFAENAAVIVIDLFSGAFANDLMRLFMGIGYRSWLWIYSVMMLALGVAIARAMINRGGNRTVSVAVAAVLPVAVDFISVMWKSITSLIEWDFMPYADEIATIVAEIGVVLLMGVASAVTAVLLSGKKRD